jgi:DNA polymerase-3 subunit delta
MATVTAAELLRNVRADKWSSIYLLQGEERLLFEEALAALQDAALQGGLADFNFDRFRGKETDAARLETALGTSPMMGPRRLVLVRDFTEVAEGAREVLVAFAKNPAPKTILVLAAEKPDARTAAYKALSGAATVVKFETPYERELAPWCRERASSLGVTLEASAAQRLVEIVGRDMSGLSSAIERAALFVGGGGRITAETIERTAIEEREQSAFELCDVVGGGSASRAWPLAMKILSQREHPLRLVGLLARHYRQLLRLRQARDAGRPRDAAGTEAGVSPWALKNLWPQTERHSVASLCRAIEALAEADVALKSSRLPAELVFERLVVSLCRLAEREAR